jgi:hypothetical protein
MKMSYMGISNCLTLSGNLEASRRPQKMGRPVAYRLTVAPTICFDHSNQFTLELLKSIQKFYAKCAGEAFKSF